jgi:tRNA threonylcarbamoyladenosine biosynthesis protein TsaE
VLAIDLPTRRATVRLARAIAARIEPGDVVLLDGDLGAGKTFLARALLRGLGLAEAIAVPSPTFTLMNEYPRDLGVRVPVVHADLYRVRGDGDAAMLLDAIDDLGLRARRGEGWALLVEWAGEVPDAFGGDVLRVKLARAEQGRRAELEGIGARGESLARAVIDALG